MTKEQERRVIDAIADCDHYIDKESKRNADLRPIEVQKLLEWHISHREKLIGMLGRDDRCIVN